METLLDIGTWCGSYLLCRPPHNKNSDGELLSGFKQSLLSWQKTGCFIRTATRARERQRRGKKTKKKKPRKKRFQNEQDEQVSSKETKGKKSLKDTV